MTAAFVTTTTQKVRNTTLRVAFYDSGSGDHATIFFDNNLTFIRAFDHESYTNPWTTGKIWPGVLHNLPSGCRRFLKHNAYEITSVLWHTGADWEYGSPAPLPNGQEPDPTFWMFDDIMDTFSTAALAESFSDHNDSHIPPEVLSPFLRETPLTEEIIHLVNPDANTKYVKHIAETVGYPSRL